MAIRIPSLRLTAATLSLGCLAMPALAQTSLAPSTRVATPLGQLNGASSVPALPQPEALFPDLFGLGPTLRDHGIAVLLDNTNEFDGVISGPQKGTTNSGQYALETDIDWEKLANLRGFSTHTVVVGRYGIPASRIFGDNLDPSQEIYGSGGNVVVHLVYAYGEETVARGRFDVAFGRIPFLNDFSSSPLYCNFQNNAFCGNPKASSDNIAHSSYPDAGWAIRARGRPTVDTYLQTGIFFDEAGIYTNAFQRTGFRFDSAQIDGETFPVEAGWEPSFGADKMPGHYKLGFAFDNTNHADDYFAVNGSAIAQSGLGARQLHGSTAEWAEFDQMVMRNGAGATDGVIVFGRLLP